MRNSCYTGDPLSNLMNCTDQRWNKSNKGGRAFSTRGQANVAVRKDAFEKRTARRRREMPQNTANALRGFTTEHFENPLSTSRTSGALYSYRIAL